MSIESVMPSNHLILCCPLLLQPSIFPSTRVFSNESFLHIKWPKYWRLSFSISPFMNIQNWFALGLTGLISLQFKGLSRVASNTTVWSVNSSALSFLYSQTLTSIHDYWKQTKKTKSIALTRGTFVCRVMSLFSNILSMLVIAFLRLLISWLQSSCSVILEPPPKKKNLTVSIVSPFICHEIMGPDVMFLVFFLLLIN